MYSRDGIEVLGVDFAPTYMANLRRRNGFQASIGFVERNDNHGR